jgi:signal transduction histidine kinase
MREELTHTLVHDLRSPLTTIAGMLELMEMEEPTSRRREMIQLARASARTMLDLVNAILDVGRLESGDVPLRRKAVALTPMVEEAVGLQAPLARDRQLTVVSRMQSDPPAAWADPALVARVLQNLVGNAIKFTKPGGKIVVSAGRHGEDRDMVLIAVKDEGPGVPPEMEDRLFEKFCTGSQKEKGTGLGLAFCRLAVEAHGGRVWAESQPGHGSTFAFTLPVAGRA